MKNEELLKIGVERNNLFLQGYICAIVAIIQMNEEVDTNTKELFDAGVGKLTLSALKERGVCDADLGILEKYWYQLHNIVALNENS